MEDTEEIAVTTVEDTVETVGTTVEVTTTVDPLAINPGLEEEDTVSS